MGFVENVLPVIALSLLTLAPLAIIVANIIDTKKGGFGE